MREMILTDKEMEQISVWTPKTYGHLRLLFDRKILNLQVFHVNQETYDHIRGLLKDIQKHLERKVSMVSRDAPDWYWYRETK